jgi:hypothetical protein
MQVHTGIYLEFPAATNRSSLVEKWELPKEVEVHDSRPGNSTTIKRDPGMQSHGPMSVTFADDSSQTIAQYLDTNLGSKVTFVARKDSAAVGATNYEWTGTFIIQGGGFDAEQGGPARFTVAFPIDGAATGASS